MELKSFIKDKLDEIFSKCEKYYPEIEAAELNLLPPDAPLNDKKVPDPFDMYSSYLNLVRPVDIEDRNKLEMEEIRMQQK